ncbi:MAG TPA: permease-like cell division protein FtsX, partial [Pseudomonadales bacterium]|nr:permease-like cell division protein FtsX [Pseudomonadales bacterium]
MARGQNSARRQPPGWRDRLRGYVLQHRSHCRDSLRRLLAEPMATLMIWSMVGIALALPSGLYLLLDNLKQVSEGWSEGSRRITLYLKIEQSDEMARLLGERLGRDAEIAAVKVIGREAALLEFRQRSKLDDVIDALGSNPLPPLLLITPRADSGGIEPL